MKIVRRDQFDHARPFQREFDGIRHYEPISRGHPNLVAILHVGGTDDCFFYVLELADDAIGQGNARPHPGPLPEKADGYLGTQMAEELSSALAKIPDLRVLGRGTSAFLKSANDVRQIAQQLKLSAVLEGRVRKSENRLHVSAQLIRPSDDSLLWSEVYDRDLPEIFGIQTDIAERVAARLNIRLSDTTRQRLSLKPTRNLEAYESYLQGRSHWSKRTADDLNKAIEHFQKASLLDTNFALAYVGLADCYCLLSYYGGVAPGESFPKAKAAAGQALGMDDLLAEAHASLGYSLANYDWDWSGAESEYRRAIALAPNYAPAHHWFGNLLVTQERFDEAKAEMKRALELDPLSLIINKTAGDPLYFGKEYDQAIAQFRKTLELDPNFYLALLFLGMAHEQQGQFPEAIAAFQKARRVNDIPRVLAALGHAYAISGEKSKAREVLDELTAMGKQHYLPPYDVAVIFVGLGETNQAFAWLQKADEDKSEWMAQG